LSFQLFGYASYFIPALLVTIGWNYFWCRSFDAAITKATGTTLLAACLSALLSLLFGTLEVSGKAFRAGGWLLDAPGGELSAALLCRAGGTSAIAAGCARGEPGGAANAAESSAADSCGARGFSRPARAAPLSGYGAIGSFP